MSFFELLMALTVKAAYVSLPLFLVKLIADRHPLTRYYFRISLYVSTLSLCSAWGVLVSIAMTVLGKRFDINYVVARSFYALSSKVMGITFAVQGEQHLDTRPAVIVGNHQSMLDIIYLGRIFPQRASIMAKKELQWMPFLGQYMSLSGAVFIDRASNKSAVAALGAAGESMKSKGISLWVFPEGTRHSAEKSDMLPFKKGAFHLAVQAGVPIIPVVCQNYWTLYHKGALEPGELKIRVLPPIPTESLTAADIPDLIIRVRDTMVSALRELDPPILPASSSRDATPLPIPHVETTGLLTSAVKVDTPVYAESEASRDGSGSKDGSAVEVSAGESEDEGVLVDRPVNGGQ